MVDKVTPVVMFVSLMLVGSVAGIFLATQLGQVRVQDRLGARDFTLVKHSFEIAVGGIMPVLVIAAGVSLAVTLVVLLVGDGLWSLRVLFAALALALWVAVVVVTLRYNAPVNALAAGWDPEAPPADWAALRDQWHFGQTVRTPLSLAAFAALTLIAVLPEGRGVGP